MVQLQGTEPRKMNLIQVTGTKPQGTNRKDVDVVINDVIAEGRV